MLLPWDWCSLLLLLTQAYFTLTALLVWSLWMSASTLVLYGKTLPSSTSPPVVPNHQSSSILPESLFTAPSLYCNKRLAFASFYALGFCFSLSCLLMLLIARSMDHSRLGVITGTRGLILLALLVIQTTRRFLETLLIQPPSSASVHLFHLAAGLLFYPAASLLCLACAITTDSGSIQHARPLDVTAWLLIAAFGCGSLCQHQCHLYLAYLRTTNDKSRPRSSSGTPSQYSFPDHPWFRHTANPHYLAEMFIYASMTLLEFRFWPVLLWVAVDLCVAGAKSLAWYRKQFSDRVPLHWSAVIPFIF